MVDAINIDRQLHDPRPDGAVNEAQVQVAYADLILLNKVSCTSWHVVGWGSRSGAVGQMGFVGLILLKKVGCPQLPTGSQG